MLTLNKFGFGKMKLYRPSLQYVGKSMMTGNVNIYGIGLPRTGTNSLAFALNKLGINGENYCILHNHQQKWDHNQHAMTINKMGAPCQHKHENNGNIHPLQNEDDETISVSNYKFFVQNDAYKDIEGFVTEKLNECDATKFILTHRANKELWTESVRKIQSKLNNDDEFDLPDPILYEKHVIDCFKQYGILDKLLILDLFHQQRNAQKQWYDICQFLDIDVKDKTNESFPHINL